MSAIVDVYDAVTADRVYKRGCSRPRRFASCSRADHHFDRVLVTKFIKCMGSIRSAPWQASFSNQRLAVVMQRNEQQPLKYVVKVIYHAATQRHYLEVQWLDLARSGVQETIENTVDPKGVWHQPGPISCPAHLGLEGLLTGSSG